MQSTAFRFQYPNVSLSFVPHVGILPLREGDALLGMALLYGFRICLDVVSDGSVTIEALL